MINQPLYKQFYFVWVFFSLVWRWNMSCTFYQMHPTRARHKMKILRQNFDRLYTTDLLRGCSTITIIFLLLFILVDGFCFPNTTINARSIVSTINRILIMAIRVNCAAFFYLFNAVTSSICVWKECVCARSFPFF